MAVNILLKRSATASKRPVGASMAFGELNLNYDAATGGLYYKDSAGGVVKVGPCQVSDTAPNSTAAGSTGNSAGEFWYDSSTNTLKVYNGTAWVESGGAVDSVTGTAPITVDNTDPLNPIVGISAASTTAPGAVQLNDTTSSSSITEALTANQGRNLQEQINALSVSSNLTLAGTLDASTGNLVTVTTEGAAQGFVIGGPLPSPAAGNAEFFVIATVGASSYTPPGGSATQVHIGDWFLSSGTVWEFLDVGFQAAYASTTTPGVVQLATDAEVQAGVETTHAVTPSGLQSKVSDSVSTTSSTTLASSTAVKAAYDAGVQGQTDAAAAQATADAALPKAGGTMTGNITFSDAGEGVVFSDASSVVAISDSTSTTSSTTAASSTAVKTAKDAADAAQSDATQALSDAAAAQATADQAVLDAAAAQATADAAIPQSGGSLTGELLVNGGYITTPAGETLFISSGAGGGISFNCPGGTTDFSGERVLIQSGSSDPNAINFVSANGGVQFDSATSIGLNLAEDLQINGDGGLAGYILQSNGSGAAPTWVPQSEGDVTGVTGTAPITVDNTDPQNPVVGIDAASTSAAGAVQLNDTVTSTSDTEAATANAAKTAYDAAVAAQGDATQALADAAAAQADATQALSDAAAAQATADAALPKAGGTMTGDITFSGAGNGIVFQDASTVEAISNSTSLTSSVTAASSTAVKAAYDAAVTAAASDPFASSNVLFVNPTTGNNTTAARGTAKPYATLTAALAAASDGDFIYMAPGTYIENPVINKGVTILGSYQDLGTWQGTKIQGNTQLNLSASVTRNCAIYNVYFISTNSTPPFEVIAHATAAGNTIIANSGFTQQTSADVNQFAFRTAVATWVRAIYTRNCLFDGNVKHNAGTAAGASGYLVMDNTIGAGSSSYYYHILTGTVEFRNPSQALSPIYQTGGVVSTSNVLGFTSNSATTTTIFGGTGFNYKGSAASVGTGTVYFGGGYNTAGGKVDIGANLVYGWTNLNVTPANLTINVSAVPYTTAVPSAANVVVAQQTRPQYNLLTTTSSVTAANQLATVLDGTTGILYSVTAFDAGTY